VGEAIPLEATPAGLVFNSGQPLLIRRPDPAKFPADDLATRPGDDRPKSACLAPLISHGRKLGIVGVSCTQPDKFTEDDLELFSQIAGPIAIAVENALNFERARAAEHELARKLEHLQLLLRINNAVVSQLDMRELIGTIFDCLSQAVPHDSAGILLYDRQSNRLRMSVTNRPDLPLVEENYPISLEGSVAGLSFTSGQPVFIDRLDLERFPSEYTRRAYNAGIRSTGSVPLIARKGKLGVVSVWRLSEGAFHEEEIELLCQVANQVAIAVENALAFREIEILKNELASEKLYLEDEIRTEHNFEELIGGSMAFKRILKQVETVAPTDSAVLIRGETGTGKELIARAIHSLSQRRERTLVKVNCAAIPMGLLESELFGHEKGAFTGAISQRVGRFELANRGTLFLDEVGDIPLDMQPKLLRVLQEQEFERLGSTRTQNVDVRLIAATNCDLEQMVGDKKYRSDLYYRLNVFPITIPPLRERREDIAPLTRFFTQKYARRLKKRIETISSEALTALTNYHWPGNIRELEHFVERAVVVTQGTELEVSLSGLKPAAQAAPGQSSISTLEVAEREHILRALEESNWVVGGPHGAAARLGMKRTTLQSRMQKLGLERARS
jgi:formate hydrogenlyase transcriptional activator